MYSWLHWSKKFWTLWLQETHYIWFNNIIIKSRFFWQIWVIQHSITSISNVDFICSKRIMIICFRFWIYLFSYNPYCKIWHFYFKSFKWFLLAQLTIYSTHIIFITVSERSTKLKDKVHKENMTKWFRVVKFSSWFW